LVLAALNGLVYALFSWQAGRFAERAGYFTALRLGFVIMLGAWLTGSQVESAGGQVVVMLVAVVGMCFTWPTLEALVSGGERRAGVQHMVGVYNVVWAATGAVAYFIGGAGLEKGGLNSLFYVPAAIAACQLALTLWLETKARRSAPAGRLAPQAPAEPEQHPHPPAEVNRFLRMSWLANPCAYVAINTLVALMPGIAGRLGLSTMLAGFSGSVWCFARLGAFWLFWVWAGWHYRFRWLFSAYLGLVSSFALILVVPSLAVLVAAQLVFGLAIGLIYYSSLFYSMDASETKGEHGGIHEAAIGLGNFAGPAVGAASLHFLPQHASSGAVAVTLLLLGGLAALGVIWRRNRP
ncbi:MAG TPA: MFS transporter, partial [Candidatus Paceibacterota bacterium]|nr:MFS transporter [Candidatus Paceibacterota bacterium]